MFLRFLVGTEGENPRPFGEEFSERVGGVTMGHMQKKSSESLLGAIKGSEDVRALSHDQLGELCQELRHFLIDTVSRVGGHFGSNLGVVELTVALHHVYDAEKDRIIWDVGHQAYAHKVLTGRRDKLCTIRKKGGLAPFPKRHESESDAFGVGHASTSISAGVGMTLAHRDKVGAPHVIAIIGDGSLTGGMAFEALNHAGDVEADMLVIVNDNKMSISPNVGAMTRYLTRLISSSEYSHARETGGKLLESIPALKEVARRVEKHAKGMVTPSTIFEEMGFQYFGPVDGHDVSALVELLNNLKKIKGPRLLHVVTKKGKGCVHAENDPLALHAVASFDKLTGEKHGGKEIDKTFTSFFSSWVVAKADERLHVVTPAMREGSGLVEFSALYPTRFHDVGIAEQHAVTFAAGLACEGKKPVVAIYSTFLQRAYDQLIHDVAIQNLDVLFAIDRAGIVGPDGETHAGSFDLSFLRCIPNMVILAPSDGDECERMLDFGFEYSGPVAVRYPRARAGGGEKKSTGEAVEIGKSLVVRKGTQVAILSFGALLDRCRDVANALDATLVDMRFVKPIDYAMVEELAKTHGQFITVEENVVAGGAGSAVNEYLSAKNIAVSVKNIGLPDRFLSHGTRDEVLASACLDASSIEQEIREFLKR